MDLGLNLFINSTEKNAWPVRYIPNLPRFVCTTITSLPSRETSFQ
jgi:hypothetical protein